LGLGAASVAPEPVLTMANFAGYKPIPVARWGSQVEWDDPTRLPLGIAMVVRNCQYLAESVKTRYGLQRTINGASAVTGLAMLKYTGSPAVKIPLIFSADGSFVYESPLGSGTKVAIADGFGLLNAGTNAQMEPAYDNIYLAFSDLVEGKYKPAVFNGGTKVLDPLSEKPIGITWSLTTKFRVGQVVTPTVPNGHLYRCSAVALDQLSGAVEPVWPLTDAGVIVDNNVTWTEITPGMAIVFPTPSAPALTRVAAVGNFAAGRDVYIRITLTNDFELDGETNMSPAASLIATVLHDAVQVTPPTVPGWLTALPAPYQITGIQHLRGRCRYRSAGPGCGFVQKIERVGDRGARGPRITACRQCSHSDHCQPTRAGSGEKSNRPWGYRRHLQRFGVCDPLDSKRNHGHLGAGWSQLHQR
jgi:hypothetical protein